MCLKKIKIIFFVIFLCLFYIKILQAKSNTPLQYTIIHNLEYAWQVYDTKYDSYIPYLQNRHRNTKTASFWLDLEEFTEYSLIFYAPANTYLFINQKLAFKVKNESWVSLNIDSLRKGYRKEQKVFLTFYDSEYRLPLKKVFIGKETTQKQIDKQKLIEQKIINEPVEDKIISSNVKNFTIIFGLILMVILAILRNSYNKEFSIFYGFNSNFSNNNTNPSNNYSINSLNVFFIVANSFLVALFYILAQSNVLGILPFSLNFYDNNANSFLILLLNYTSLLFIIILFLLAKYFLLLILGIPMKIRGITNIHFYEFTRLSNLFYILATIFAIFFVLTNTSFFDWIKTTFLTTITIFHLLQSILISFYFYTNRQTQFKSLYLFYYISLTEFVPLLIGIKFLLF